MTHYISVSFEQSLQRRALSEVLPEGGRGHRRREEARQVEFVRVGQALKLDTIVKGDAPTSLATTGLFRRSVSTVYFARCETNYKKFERWLFRS